MRAYTEIRNNEDRADILRNAASVVADITGQPDGEKVSALLEMARELEEKND